jgi:hypothetical protein
LEITVKRSHLNAFLILFIFFLGACCSTPGNGHKKEYGVLVSAVMNAPFAVKGVYPANLPPDFSGTTFLQTVKGRIPDSSFSELSHYSLQVIPKGRYYLLVVREPSTNSIILFDYSCTFNIDGKVFESPAEYDLNHLELYDRCK